METPEIKAFLKFKEIEDTTKTSFLSLIKTISKEKPELFLALMGKFNSPGKVLNQEQIDSLKILGIMDDAGNIYPEAESALRKANYEIIKSLNN